MNINRYYTYKTSLPFKMLNKLINIIISLYDKLEQIWESRNNMKFIGTVTIFGFLISLILIQLNIWGYIPESLEPYIHNNYFDSIGIAFTLLLFFEVVSLVFVLPRSFAGSLIKQFEILSLILLRHAFEELKFIGDVINLENPSNYMYHMLSNAFGAAAIFGGILLIDKLQKHRDFTHNKWDKERFIQMKKVIAFALVGIFSYLAVEDLILLFSGENTFKFFETFYSVLVLSDIFIVIVSLRYNHSYIVLFRNSGFAFATVLLRVALTAPVYINSAVGIIAVLFTLLLTYIYSNYSLKK